MSLQYIIDGYNVINNPLFSKRHKKSQEPRREFLEFIRLGHLTGSFKNKVLIIFDGFSGLEPLNAERFNIDIVFTQEETADNYIKRIVDKSANTKNIIVVSNDKEIGFFIKSSGARSQSVEEFLSPLFIRNGLVFHQEKRQRGHKSNSLKAELNYSETEKINKELKDIWLKDN